MKIGNLEVYGIIYKITNKVNGKVYIGQTTQPKGFKDRYCAKGEGIERVYNHYKNLVEVYKSKTNMHLYLSIKKYGIKNFDVSEVYDVCFSKDELDIKEMMYIKKYDCVNSGYNTQEGGSECIVAKGSDVHFSKYSEDDILSAKIMLSDYIDFDLIESITGVDKKNLDCITNFRSWVDVGSEYNEKIKLNSDEYYSKKRIMKDFRIDKIPSIDIHKDEIEMINKFNNKQMRRILFILLLYSRVYGDINGEIPYPLSFLISNAKCKLNESESENIIREISNICDFVNIKENKNVFRVFMNFSSNKSDIAFTVSNYTNKTPVHEYLNYCGDKWKKCDMCEKWFKDNSVTKPRKYCNKCKKDMQLKHQRKSMLKSRKCKIY